MDDYGRRLKRTQSENVLETEEILTNILVRLPVKSLLICKCICKHWRRLIGSPYFIRLHLLRSQENPTHVRVYYPYLFRSHKKNCLIKIDREEAPDERLPEGRLFYKHIICSFNGLILFCSLKGYANAPNPLGDLALEIHICNPATREVVLLPPPHNPNLKIPDIGVCFGPKINGYKVFRFVSIQGQQGHECQVYSSITGSWKSMGPVAHSPSRSHEHSHVCINGIAYWLSKSTVEGWQVDIVLAVDWEEKFSTIRFPNETPHQSLFLINLDGCLALLIEDWGTLELSGLQDSKESLWVKKWSNPIPEFWHRPIYFGIKNSALLLMKNKFYAFRDMGTSSSTNVNRDVFTESWFS